MPAHGPPVPPTGLGFPTERSARSGGLVDGNTERRRHDRPGRRRHHRMSAEDRATVELIDLPDFGPEEYALIVDGEPDPFGTEQLGIEWRGKTAHVGLVEEGRLVACAGWVPARVTAASGQEVDVLGLGSVLVRRSYRGSGVGRRLVGGAMEKMRDPGVPVGMLFCRTRRLDFYRRLGWTRATGTVTVDQPDGVITMPLATCWVPLSSGAAWPEADVHLEGLPF